MLYVFVEKNLHISGPGQFKSMLFKDQLLSPKGSFKIFSVPINAVEVIPNNSSHFVDLLFAKLLVIPHSLIF